MKIIVVTSNKDKFDEIAKTLAEFKIEAEQSSVNITEEGSTLDEIVTDKAKKAFEALKQPLIVDDTGVYFSAYEDFPGAYPRRVFEKLGLAGLLKKLEGKDRGAFFRTILCYIDENEQKMFDGNLDGNISERIYEPGRESLPYDRIFIPYGHQEPMCALTLDQITKISHRAQATRKFAAWFMKNKFRK